MRRFADSAAKGKNAEGDAVPRPHTPGGPVNNRVTVILSDGELSLANAPMCMFCQAPTLEVWLF